MIVINELHAVPYLASGEMLLRRAGSRPARGEALRQLRLQRIRAHIDANLADPDLCAQTAARALGLSVRGLHLALAPERDSFNQVVQRRRLDACLVLLRRPDRGDTIADIAFACGFNSLSSFYRAFHRCFGACPRDLHPSGATQAAAADEEVPAGCHDLVAPAGNRIWTQAMGPLPGHQPS